VIPRRWSEETERILLAAGWFPGRTVDNAVGEWRRQLQREGGFHMSPASEEALREFGGLEARSRGPGIDRARAGFKFDPMLADGEEDRFQNCREAGVFPLGELHDGHAFIGLSPSGRVYLVGDFVKLLADNIDQAIDFLLLGKRNSGPRWE
jgi:hypothetical protein